MAGRKGNQSNQPTCALLGHNCFKLATGHCLASSTTATAIVLVRGMGDEPFHKTNPRQAETIQVFPSASLLLSIKAGWPCRGRISRRFILSSQCNGYIVLMMILIWVHKEKLNLSSSLQMPATRPASQHWQLLVITDWGVGIGESDQEAKSNSAFPSRRGF